MGKTGFELGCGPLLSPSFHAYTLVLKCSYSGYFLHSPRFPQAWRNGVLSEGTKPQQETLRPRWGVCTCGMHTLRAAIRMSCGSGSERVVCGLWVECGQAGGSREPLRLSLSPGSSPLPVLSGHPSLPASSPRFAQGGSPPSATANKVTVPPLFPF